MKKTALFLADGFEEIEALGTVDILRRAEIPVETVSITDSKKVTGAHGISVETDKIFSELDFTKTDVLILPGGMPGAKNLNEHPELKRQVKLFAENNKPVAAICAAPMVLGELGLLDGKNATCYPGFEAHLTGAKTTGKGVEVAQNIITGKGPAFVFDFALQLVETIAGADTRKTVEQGMLI